MSEKMSPEEKEKMAKAFEKILKEDDKVSGGGLATGVVKAINNKDWRCAACGVVDLVEEAGVSALTNYTMHKKHWGV